MPKNHGTLDLSMETREKMRQDTNRRDRTGWLAGGPGKGLTGDETGAGVHIGQGDRREPEKERIIKREPGRAVDGG